MQDTTLSTAICLPNEALLFDLDELSTCLQTVSDQRSRQGLRYPLASLLLIGVLAKLAGQDSSRAIAHWAKLRSQELSQLFHLKRESMPHDSTWSRVLGHGVEPGEMEEIVGRFFASAAQPTERKTGKSSTRPRWENPARNDPVRENAWSASVGGLPADTGSGARSNAG